jgi:hypothetical protein
MVGSLLSDPIYTVQNRLATAIRANQLATEQLVKLVQAHAEELRITQAKLSWLETGLQLFTAPGLRPYQREVRRQGLFDYLSDVVTFHGRQNELDSLIQFCEAHVENGGWRWQAITGQGGSGKSRLALELCKRMRQQGWEAYFLDRSALNTPPPRSLASSPVDLLLVIDYVAFATDQLGPWLAALPARCEKHLRIVLVERTGWQSPNYVLGAPAWHENLAKAWNAQDLRQHLAAVAGLNPVVSLDTNPLDVATMAEIVASIDLQRLSDANRGGPAQYISPDVAHNIAERLHTIDPLGQRPLYLLFLTQAYLDNPASDWLNWSRDDLHAIIYEREKQRLQRLLPEGMEGVALDLWAFATVTGSAISDALAEPLAWLTADITDQPQLTRKQFRTQLRESCGSHTSDVEPYAPDIPGEYLVITRLAQWLDTARVRRFALAAWECSPAGYAAFLSNALVDLADTSQAEAVLNSDALLTEPTNPEHIDALAQALVILTIKPDVDAAATRTVVNRLEEFYQKHETPDIALRIAMALVILTAKPEVDAVETRTVINRLEKFYQKHETPDIALLAAIALANLTVKPEADAVETRQIIDRLEKLYEKHSTDDIALRIAMALAKLTTKPEADAVETRQIIDRLEKLYGEHSTDDIALRVTRVLAEAYRRWLYKHP